MNRINDIGREPPRSGRGASEDLEQLLPRLENVWRQAGPPAREDSLPPDEPHRRTALVELVHTDLEYRLNAGEPARVEAYLERFPELASAPDVVAGLIRTEYEAR